MKKRNVELMLLEGTEVHGPYGWVSLKGDCAVTANLDQTGHEWHYTVNGDDWWTSRSDVVVL